ncbi:MAG TPA: hypothetical protein VFW87_16195 [Pirellulales bacterium]|nr:hypothetical protein [Pirellulales bacterium]
MTMLHYLHHGLCVTLSAALLLTNGLPMAVQHSHPVGANLSHHTHDAGLAWDARRARNDTAAVHQERVALSPASLTEVTEHIHLLWLGMEFTLPAPKGHKPDTKVSGSGAGMLARLTDQGASEASPAPSPLVLADAALIGEAVCDCFSPTVHLGPSRTVASLPLCDTARHARSGVQLA